MSHEHQNTPVERTDRDCRSCRHYHYIVDPVQDEHGHCKRYAPSPRLTTDDYDGTLYFASWPLVRNNEICSEWEWNTEIDAWIDDPEQNPRA